MDDDDLFLDDARAAPVPRVPVSAGLVVSFDPDAAGTAWRCADNRESSARTNPMR
jgi:hypothetical protein